MVDFHAEFFDTTTLMRGEQATLKQQNYVPASPQKAHYSCVSINHSIDTALCHPVPQAHFHCDEKRPYASLISVSVSAGLFAELNLLSLA
jgi:hypothetical protein